jgi:hypothetical protein
MSTFLARAPDRREVPGATDLKAELAPATERSVNS